ncbi:hypothetical protein HC231_19555 [Brenneria izadpanahii]|uniref:Uncharacterized protein n=1 Tax=Brenneria izadpanahii TaxID=2722756 RepID=A0ABX7V274_9GAMM|nr:hypothetical protein [Brenneria izadpanahii]QTF09874.1 hypothetical protein HC231_19555 [Brenneria izadpanahii]
MILQTLSNNDSLLNIASESVLQKWFFSEQRLTVNLLTSDDEELTVYVETDAIQSSTVYLNKDLNICYLSIQDMQKILPAHNGYYIPPEKFHELMKFSSKFYSMFYGRKCDYKYSVSFCGYENYITCPIKTLEDITWMVK